MNELAPLIDRAKSGDLDAFGEIVKRFEGMACGYAFAVLGDRHLAEDAAQEAFIEAYQRLRSLRVPAAFAAWLRRIVFKQCDRIARRKRVGTVQLGPELAVKAGPSPSADLEQQEMRNAVLTAILLLPAAERTVTTLFYIDGYSQKDIADFLGVPVTTVNNRLHASRERLKGMEVTMTKGTLRSNAPDEQFQQSVKQRILAQCYGLSVADTWRWIPSEPLAVARLRADGREFVMRIYTPDAEPARLDYNVEFIDWLCEQGLSNVSIVPTHAGDRYAQISTGETAMLLAIGGGGMFSQTPTEEEMSRLGEFTARLHKYCREFEPTVCVDALLFRERPAATMERALSHAARLPEAKATLDEFAPAIVSDCQRLVEAAAAQPVHGNLWTGNVFDRPGGMTVWDMRYCGIGPRTIDIAVGAYRIPAWGDRGDAADCLWHAWLDAYQREQPLSDVEVSTLPAVASLWCAHWLNCEVEEAIDRLAPDHEVEWYIEDHCRTIRGLMGTR